MDLEPTVIDAIALAGCEERGNRAEIFFLDILFGLAAEGED